MSSSSRLITCSLLFLFSQNNNQVLSLLNKPAFYHSRVTIRPSNRLAPLQFTGDLGVDLYDAQLTVSSFVETQLATLYGAGLLTAFSPCSISLLPLTLAYLGGSESTKSNEVVEGKVDRTVLTRSALYASGLATTLTLFGLSAAMLGNVFGASGLVGDLSALLSSGLFLVMGFYLLGIVEIKFPSFDGKIGKASKESGGVFSNGSVQAFLFGATSALVASPCSSPVLTSLLAFVASSGDATIGQMKTYHSHDLYTVF
jgi:cytochrome c biogenesis protein CcdA